MLCLCKITTRRTITICCVYVTHLGLGLLSTPFLSLITAGTFQQTRHVETMLFSMMAQRLRRLSSIKTALLERVVFAGTVWPAAGRLCTLTVLELNRSHIVTAGLLNAKVDFSCYIYFVVPIFICWCILFFWLCYTAFVVAYIYFVPV